MLEYRHFAPARRAPGGPEVDHQGPATVGAELDGLAVGLAQAGVGQLRALFIQVAAQAAQQPEQRATEQAPAQRTAQGGAAKALPQGAGSHRQHTGPEQEAAITQVDDLQRVVAVHGPVAEHKAQAGGEQAQQEQAEQHRLGVVASAFGYPPAHQARQGQCAEQQQVVHGHGQRPEVYGQHQP
ncbi:hypothetical protein D3C77_426130 [compost metagenome]